MDACLAREYYETLRIPEAKISRFLFWNGYFIYSCCYQYATPFDWKRYKHEYDFFNANCLSKLH